MARRGQLLVGLLALTSAALLLSGCGDTPKTPPAEKTQIQITIKTYGITPTDLNPTRVRRQLYRATTYTLSCPSGRGTLPGARAACQQLARLKDTDLNSASANASDPPYPVEFLNAEITVGGRLRGRAIQFSGDIGDAQRRPEIYQNWRDIVGTETVSRLLPQQDWPRPLATNLGKAQLQITIKTYRHFFLGSSPLNRRTTYTLSCPSGQGSLPHAALVCKRLKRFAPWQLTTDLYAKKLERYRVKQKDEDHTWIDVRGSVADQTVVFSDEVFEASTWQKIIGKQTLDRLLPVFTDKQTYGNTTHLKIRFRRKSLKTYTLSCPSGRGSLSHAPAACQRLERQLQGPLAKTLFGHRRVSRRRSSSKEEFDERTKGPGPNTLEIRGIMQGRSVAYLGGSSSIHREDLRSYRLWTAILGKQIKTKQLRPHLLPWRKIQLSVEIIRPRLSKRMFLICPLSERQKKLDLVPGHSGACRRLKRFRPSQLANDGVSIKNQTTSPNYSGSTRLGVSGRFYDEAFEYSGSSKDVGAQRDLYRRWSKILAGKKSLARLISPPD